MIVERLGLPDVLLITPKTFRDDRGEFLETWREAAYGEHGIPRFVQDNVSISRRGVLRGLHFQHPHDQGKLVSVVRGRVFDVVVDVRTGSPSFGRWLAVELAAEDHRQLYIPVGFAHGFAALTDDVVFSYKCTDYYAPAAERTIRWNDPSLGITWPVAEPIIAPKDAEAPALSDIPAEALPRYERRA